MQPQILPAGEGRPQNILGDNQTVKVTGVDTNGAFTVIEQYNDPGVGVPLHIHANEDELFYVIEGQVTFTVNGTDTEAKAGTTVFFPRGIPHAFMSSGETKSRVLITAVPAGIEKMFDELAVLPAGPPDMGTVVEICGRYGVTFVPPAAE